MIGVAAKIKLVNDKVDIVAVTSSAILVCRKQGFNEFYTIIYKGDLRVAVKSLYVDIYGTDSDYKEKPMGNGLVQIDTVLEAHRLKAILNADGKVLDVINCFKKAKYETNGQNIIVRVQRNWALTQIYEDAWINVLEYGKDTIEFGYPQDMDMRVQIKDTNGNVVYNSNNYITMCGDYFISNKSSLIDIVDGKSYVIDTKGEFEKLEQIQRGVYMKHNYGRYLSTGVTGANVVNMNSGKLYENVTVYIHNNSAGVVVLKKEDKTVLIRNGEDIEFTGKVSIVLDKENKTIILTDSLNNKAILNVRTNIYKVYRAFEDISNRKG